MLQNLYPRMITKFKEVALFRRVFFISEVQAGFIFPFRRAIKVFDTMKPNNSSAFTKKVGCGPDVAGQLFKRLEAEGTRP
jgi:hypothetical protein